MCSSWAGWPVILQVSNSPSLSFSHLSCWHHSLVGLGVEVSHLAWGALCKCPSGGQPAAPHGGTAENSVQSLDHTDVNKIHLTQVIEIERTNETTLLMVPHMSSLPLETYRRHWLVLSNHLPSVVAHYFFVYKPFATRRS